MAHRLPPAGLPSDKYSDVFRFNTCHPAPIRPEEPCRQTCPDAIRPKTIVHLPSYKEVQIITTDESLGGPPCDLRPNRYICIPAPSDEEEVDCRPRPPLTQPGLLCRGGKPRQMQCTKRAKTRKGCRVPQTAPRGREFQQDQVFPNEEPVLLQIVERC